MPLLGSHRRGRLGAAVAGVALAVGAALGAAAGESGASPIRVEHVPAFSAVAREVRGVSADVVPRAGRPIAPRPVPVEPATLLGEGLASFYAASLAGRPTASGEPYRPDELTAAHRSLPFGARLRVTEVRSGRSVVVRVNDRGPFHGSRVIDLSRAAARYLGLIERGVGTVRIELLPPVAVVG